jgi:hypothetical protein
VTTLVPTPEIRHVRTGKYDGTGVVTVGDKAVTRTRPLTECGAVATSVDWSSQTARIKLRDGHVAELCRDCRAKLETLFGWCDLSNLPDHSGSSTAEQRQLIHHLLEEAYQNRYWGIGLNGNTIDQLSSRKAAETINELKVIKVKGWKRRPHRPREFEDTVLNDLVANLPKGVGTRARNAITNRHITTLAQLNATDPYVLFATKNAGVGVIKALLEAGVWPGVSLSSATHKGVNKKVTAIAIAIATDAAAKSKTDCDFLLALKTAKTAPVAGFQKLLQLGRSQKKSVPPKVSRMQAAAIVKTLRILSDILDTNQKVALMKILRSVETAAAKKGKK